MKVAGRIKQPRKFPQLVTALAYLDACGATDVSVSVKGHIHVAWRIGPRRTAITLSSSPSNVEDCCRVARQLIRRRYREAGSPVFA